MRGKMQGINWLRTKKMMIIGILIGALGGYLYWRIVGCATGACAITSVWWRSTLYGALMGAFAFDIIKDYLK
jgi:hypothetical protein